MGERGVERERRERQRQTQTQTHRQTVREIKQKKEIINISSKSCNNNILLFIMIKTNTMFRQCVEPIFVA